MTLPGFLQAKPLATTSLQDTHTMAYRTLISRWLIDLALVLEWGQPRQRSLSRHRSRFYKNQLSDLIDFDADDLDDDYHDDLAINSKRAFADHRKCLQQQRDSLAQVTLDPELPLVRNLGFIAELLRLTEAEQGVLCFAVLLHADADFQRAVAEQSQVVSITFLHKLLAHLLGLEISAVEKALHSESALCATGLVNLSKHQTDLEKRIGIRCDLPMILLSPHPDADSLVACFVKRSPHGTLTLANFPHLSRDTLAAAGLLQAALRHQLVGTNLILYGPPGIGKTEYVIALAEAVGAELYEVAYADEDGDPIRGEGRLQSFNLCQRLLAERQNALLLFDEIEDAFERDPWSEWLDRRSRAVAGKAWLNRTLENNPIPALWLTNDVRAMGTAYLRRFDYAIRFTTPPQSVRVEIARYHLGHWAGEDDWLQGIAAHEQWTPAQLERAAKLARYAGPGDQETDRALILQALDRSATLLGQQRAPIRHPVPTGYDLRFLHIDQDIVKLIAALQRRRQGLFCFYGPAGTGKSELARYIAHQVEKPLLVKRASDLLSMYVGQTEQQLAAMFHEAHQGEAVLVLDEADSFLRDRRDAHHSWEISQVNELLTQMEAFDGIFICTTNLMDVLDGASLRRFPWKIRFDYLKPAQRWGLFVQEFTRLGGSLAQAATYQESVVALNRLTPGDVAAVVRQFELWDETPSAKDFYQRLMAEVTMKKPEAGKLVPSRYSQLVTEKQFN